MRLATICFHKNLERYPNKWIEKYRNSILNQTYKGFDIFEINYGEGKNRIFENSIFESINLSDHAMAHNYLLDKIFSLDYDCAANSNCDDFYSLDRLEKQIKYMEAGYDVVSSNFYIIDENDNIKHRTEFHNKDILAESNKDHNIIAHPVLCYSRKFWTTCTKLVSNEIPRDDFELWKRSYAKKNYKFIILPDFLLYYRISELKTIDKTKI